MQYNIHMFGLPLLNLQLAAALWSGNKHLVDNMIFKDRYLQSENVISEVWTETGCKSFDTSVEIMKLLMQIDLMAIFCLFSLMKGVSALLKETRSYSSVLPYQERKHRITHNRFYYLLCDSALFNFPCTSVSKINQISFMLVSFLYFHSSSNSC